MAWGLKLATPGGSFATNLVIAVPYTRLLKSLTFCKFSNVFNYKKGVKITLI